MAVQLAYTKEMSREKWLLQRKNGIGGSDASAILGLNPYKSKLEVYMDKVTPNITEEDLKQTESQYWGTVMEDIVAREFSKRTGFKVRRNNFMLQHSRYPFMIADIDREIVGEDMGLECKTASEYTKNEWGEDKIPDYYYAQVQHYMAVTGYKGFYVAVLIGGNKYKHYYIERDKHFIANLIEREKEFWYYVENRRWPEPDGSKATEKYIERLYPNGIPVSVRLPDDMDTLFFEREEIQQKISELEGKIRAIDNRIKNTLKEHEKGYTAYWTVSWPTVNSRKIDSKKLKEEQPEIYGKYTVKSSYRRFSINRKVKEGKNEEEY